MPSDHLIRERQTNLPHCYVYALVSPPLWSYSPSFHFRYHLPHHWGQETHPHHMSTLCHLSQEGNQHGATTHGTTPSTTSDTQRCLQSNRNRLAGPFLIKKGHTRRPVLIKCYICVFVCSLQRQHIWSQSPISPPTHFSQH